MKIFSGKFTLFIHHGHAKDGRIVYIERIGQLDITQLFEATTEDRMFEFFVKGYELQLRYKFPALQHHFGKYI